MARYLGPRFKVIKSLGINLPGLLSKANFSKIDCANEYLHNKKNKPSDYKLRLKEKQKIKLIDFKEFVELTCRADKICAWF